MGTWAGRTTRSPPPATRYIDAYKLDKDDRQARALHTSLQLYWLELLRHAGVDGDRLTKGQFVTANRFAAIDTSRLNVMEGVGHVLFDAHPGTPVEVHTLHQPAELRRLKEVDAELFRQGRAHIMDGPAPWAVSARG
ncbi:hypothetical protein [Streptomyces alanosinicus]|uniref:Uncharacterized protein n=1 Tax=Streptomyces alanosinicus TaxID=68171 RepID=A0A918YSZ1_9ACTN|nr:hypothetical protein [Streptomyces alanosinicus]GHE14401.1 hypothetical protein GCM10010339_84910 [Streptomyces alanosinicus]